MKFLKSIADNKSILLYIELKLTQKFDGNQLQLRGSRLLYRQTVRKDDSDVPHSNVN